MEKGILDKEMEVFVAKWLDEQIKLKAPFSLISGTVFRVAVSTLDNRFADKIPDPYKTEIRAAITGIFLEKDYATAVTRAMDFTNSIVNLPFLSDESEEMLFRGLATVITAALIKVNTPKE